MIPFLRQIGDWAAGLRYADIPSDVVHAAKRCIIDTAGVILAGSTSDTAEKVNRYASSIYGSGKANRLGFPGTLSPPGAARVNGAAGHVLDFDDTSYTGIMHGSVTVFPAALAAVQSTAGNGKKLLNAFIAGSEAAYCTAAACGHDPYFRGWWTTGIFGGIGTAAAAAVGLGLSPEKTTTALSLAAVQAGGIKAAFGSDAKPYLSGRTAATGVEAALLAAGDLACREDAMENANGFFHLFNDDKYDDGVIKSLGKTWRLIQPGIFFKQYPVCSSAHAGAELTGQLVNRYRLAPDDIVGVICEVPELVRISLVYDRPTIPREAQFSMPFAVGCVLAFKGISPEHLNPEILAQPSLKKEMGKVTMRPLSRPFMDELKNRAVSPECARVVIRTGDGRDIRAFLPIPRGMPDNPLSDDELGVKFRHCARFAGIDGNTADAALDQLRHLEKLKSLDRLFGTFTGNPRA